MTIKPRRKQTKDEAIEALEAELKYAEKEVNRAFSRLQKAILYEDETRAKLKELQE